MNEFRRDRTTGLWTIVAPERGRRPHSAKSSPQHRPGGGSFDPDCPFCPGNEAMLPPINEEIASKLTPGWQCRALPNKFPIVMPQSDQPRETICQARGIHEVIIETPVHDADLDELAEPAMRSVVDIWHSRFAAALSRPGIGCVCLFRNHGKTAGASLVHAHSQMIALPALPPRLGAILEWACDHFAETGRCATCDELKIEESTGVRLVERTEHFAVLVPFAASCPLEQWIVPRRHQASFSHLAAEERNVLADVLQRTVRRMKSATGGAAYNCTVEPGSARDAFAEAAHWSMRILPDLTTGGGFEIMSGLPVNPSSPETDAAALRNVNC